MITEGAAMNQADHGRARELSRLRSRRYYQHHSEACRRQSRIYAKGHREEVRWTKHLWYLRNKDRLKAKRLGVKIQKLEEVQLAQYRRALHLWQNE